MGRAVGFAGKGTQQGLATAVKRLDARAQSPALQSARAIVPLAVLGKTTPFWWWSSAICLLIGAVHLVGVLQVWARLP